MTTILCLSISSGGNEDSLNHGNSNHDRSDHGNSQQIESGSDVGAPDKFGQNVEAPDEFGHNVEVPDKFGQNSEAPDEFGQKVIERKKVLSLSRSLKRTIVNSRFLYFVLINYILYNYFQG